MVSGQTAVVSLQDKIFPVQFTFAGSAASGTVVTGTVYPFGLNNPSTSTSFQIPQGSKYQLVDMYVASTPQVDGQIIFNLNGVPQGENFILSTIVASNSARARIMQPLVLNPGDVFTVQLVSNAANSLTTSNTDTLYLGFVQVPA